MIKVRVKFPGGYTRRVQIDGLNRAIWVTKIDGEFHRMVGYINKQNVFVPFDDWDQRFLKLYKPIRRSFQTKIEPIRNSALGSSKKYKWSWDDVR